MDPVIPGPSDCQRRVPFNQRCDGSATETVDFERARISFLAFSLAVLLHLVALARYGGQVDWSPVSNCEPEGGWAPRSLHVW